MARPKEITIILRKIVSEDYMTGEIEYDSELIFFKIAVQQYMDALGSFGTFSQIQLNAADFSDGNGGYYGTHLVTFKSSEPAGTTWQAFDTNGNKLGFRLRKQNSNNRKWVIYNEEIGAYMCGISNVEVPHFCLYVPYGYVNSDTTSLSDVANVAEQVYNLKSYEFIQGFDTNKHNVLGFTGLYNGVFYSLTGDGYACMTAHTKLRYFSSWYKLITGRFYQQENLFSVGVDNPRLTDPEKQEFYFGKILETSDSAPIDPTRVETMAQYTDHDNSIAARDLIYGTSLSARWFLPEYGNDTVSFKNGMTISLTRSGNIGYQTAEFAIPEEDETISTYTLKQVFNNADSMGRGPDFGPYKTSRLQYVLSNVDYGFYNDYAVIYDAGAIFMSPMYNSIPADAISDYIRNMEDPEDPSEWGQYPIIPFRFYVTYTSDTSTDTMDNVYDGTYTPLYMNFTYTGWCGAPTGNTYQAFDTIYNPNYPDAGCDITDKEVWAIVMAYEAPQPEPPKGGGSITGGGNGTFDNTGDNIGTVIGDGIPLSMALATCYLGDIINDESALQDKLADMGDWLGDYSLSVWVTPAVKIDTVVGLKCVRFPEAPQLYSQNDFSIKGLDWTPSTGSQGVVCQGNLVTRQYSTYSFGTFKVTKYFDSFVDYEKTSIKLFLPYAGELDLDPSDVIDNECELKCTIDWQTGNICWSVIVDNSGNIRGNDGSLEAGSGNKSEMYHLAGNTAYDIPITATDFAGKTAAILGASTMVLGLATGLGAGAIKDNPISAVGLGAKGMPHMASMAMENSSAALDKMSIGGIVKGGAAAGTLGAGGIRTKATTLGSVFGLNGTINVQYPYLQITRPIVQNPDPEIFGHMYGWKTSVAGKLGDFHGMTVVKDVHLEGITGATIEELQMIDEALKTGIIL